MNLYGLHEGDFHYLPGEISGGGEGLGAKFQAVFSSDSAKSAKGVVYFFLSERPVPRVKGESRILYIGKTNGSLHKRYFRYAGKLAAGRSGEFYGHIVGRFGPIRIGYLESATPDQLEREFFKKYVREHLEYPPKSKVG
jgi:hypothetical protein